jgi:hypothetical protein
MLENKGKAPPVTLGRVEARGSAAVVVAGAAGCR